MIKLFTNIFFLIYFTTIGYSQTTAGILQKISAKCDTAELCNIKLKDITTFKWDKVYIFSVDANQKKIDSAIGFHYNYVKWEGERIVFLLKGKIVYHEDYMPYPNYKGHSAFFSLNGLFYKGNYETTSFKVEMIEYKSKQKIFYSIQISG